MFLKNLSAGESLASYPLALARAERIFWHLHRERCWCTGGTVQYLSAGTHPVLTSERWTFSGLLCYCKGKVTRVTIKGVCGQQGSMVPSVINMAIVSDYFFTGETARWKDHMGGERALSRGVVRCSLTMPSDKLKMTFFIRQFRKTYLYSQCMIHNAWDKNHHLK